MNGAVWQPTLHLHLAHLPREAEDAFSPDTPDPCIRPSIGSW